MYIHVLVKPNSKKESLIKKDDSYLISIKEVAENNLANKKVFEVLKNLPELKDKRIILVRGHHSPKKVFKVITK
jgi:uncharacterized protein YggU (UPF0235/DUF167 family)